MREDSTVSETSHFVNNEIPRHLKFEVEFAPFWRRFLALVIDSFIILVAMTVILIFIVVVMVCAWIILPPVLTTLILTSIGLLTVFATSILYFSIMESSKNGGTLGKRLLGIKVVDLNGHKISFRRAFGRNCAKILSVITYFIGFIMALFTKKKQSLHDMIAKTLVVKKTFTPVVEEMELVQSEFGQSDVSVEYVDETVPELDYEMNSPRKKWIFIVIVAIGLFLIGVGLGENVIQPDEPLIGESAPEAVPVPVDLNAGTWTCGVDIVPGEYTVTLVGGSSCNFVVRDENGNVKENVVLATSHDGFVFVASEDVVLEEGDTIEIDIDYPDSVVHFEPFLSDGTAPEPVMKPGTFNLEEGTWTCGAEGDVAPGTYIVSSVDGPATIEISGTHHEFETLTSTVSWMPFGASTTQIVLLNEGDSIEVTGTIHLEPAEE